jgi:hypothetical protein
MPAVTTNKELTGSVFFIRSGFVFCVNTLANLTTEMLSWLPGNKHETCMASDWLIFLAFHTLTP